MIVYNVCCRIRKAAHAESWEKWMREEHMRDVIKAGAQAATLSRREEDGIAAYEARYLFASRAAYEDYLTRHAPRLRAEGARLFPPGDDFVYSRNHATLIEAQP